MDILIRLLIALEAIVCLLLIGIVLIQRSKGQGVGLSFGGGAEAVFGAQMGNVLTRATVVLAVIFLVNTAILAILKPTSRGGSLAERAPVKAAERAEVPVASAEDAAEALEFLETEAADIEVPAAVEQTAVDVETVDAEAAAVEVVAEEAPAVEAPVVETPAAEAAEAPAIAVPTVVDADEAEKTDDEQ